MKHSSAFTLIELLIVMAIMGLLLAISVPAISSLGNAGNTNQAVSGISLILGEARTYAMAHNVYVWVGFAQDSNAQTLKVAVVAGRTGYVDDLSSNSTYIPIIKPQTFNFLSLAMIGGLTGMSANADDISTSQVGAFGQPVSGTTVTFTEVLQYNPDGEATIDKSSGSSHWIQIGMQPVRGGKSNDPNVAVIQVATLTGQIQVFRQ